MIIPSYIIHLERADRRLAQARALRALLGPRSQIVPAVDGKALSDADIDAVRAPCSAPRYPFGLSPAEVAIFLSHRACWKRMIDEGHDAALIIEDDVALDPEFGAACDLTLANLREGCFVRFPVRNQETGPTIAAREGVRLIRPQGVALGMQAQIVTRGAAERLLAASVCFDRPVDTFMQLHWLHGVDVLSVWPSGVSEVSADLGGSTIKTKIARADRIRHEVRRPIYRLAVRLQSLWHRNDA